MEKQLIVGPGYEGGLGGRIWSPGIKVGPWLFLSGVTAVDYENGETVGLSGGGGMTPPSIDPEAQWRQVLTNIKVLLAAAGGTMRDVVLANVFVTDMRYYYEYEWIRREFFEPPYPVSTAVAVRSLVRPDWLLEIEIQAYIEGTA
ncbi:MAG: RidA family protein [Candidatus Dormibacteraceae bacterium]